MPPDENLTGQQIKCAIEYDIEWYGKRIEQEMHRRCAGGNEGLRDETGKQTEHEDEQPCVLWVWRRRLL